MPMSRWFSRPTVAVKDPARSVAPEELHPGDQLGAHRDKAGTDLGAGAQLLEKPL